MAKWIKYILFLVIGLLLLFFAFKNTNLNDLIEEAKKVDLLWIWLSMFFGFLAFISRGLRWVYLIENMGYNELSTWHQFLQLVLQGQVVSR